MRVTKPARCRKAVRGTACETESGLAALGQESLALISFERLFLCVGPALLSVFLQ